ncbi:sorbitol dehydrogenase [Agromyces rhizosphaerae]|uniref:Sorbitol dehydrogenase n=1 Tax=Agromyces rhizosphaerae TaxID=88374 RepID=A0A9W6FNF0_9MICO|nr:sorbitol dehydrogenase [Agromyces rhizosphaerae]
MLHGVQDLRIEERPIPVPAAGEVLVKVEATGVCGSDVHYYRHGRIDRYVVDAPMVLGHESAGSVVEVGADVDPGLVGRVVAIEPGIPDGTCAQCRAGRYNLCPAVRFHATPPIDGSLADYVVVPAAFAHPAPAGMRAERAAMAEPVSVGVAAARKAGIGVGARVLVIGAGPVGLFAAQVARAQGAEQVVVTDVNERRMQLARRLRFAAPADGEEFDVVLECSGHPDAFAAGLRAAAPAARVVLIGMGADEYRLPVGLVQGRELTLMGQFRYANTYPAALGLIADGRVDVDSCISHRFELADAEAALTIGQREPSANKVVVVNVSEGLDR